MVGLVNSGIQQQIPAANTFQPGGKDEPLPHLNDGQKQTQETQPTGTPAAQSQQTETRSNGHEEKAEVQASAPQEKPEPSSNARRGSVLDISV